MPLFSNIQSFQEARKLRNPPPLVTHVEFDSGGGRATLSSCESNWRVVATLGAAAVTAVGYPIAEGTKSVRVTWNRNNALSMIATTLSTGVNLGQLDTAVGDHLDAGMGVVPWVAVTLTVFGGDEDTAADRIPEVEHQAEREGQ